jgi:probable rRNA maturation factor
MRKIKDVLAIRYEFWIDVSLIDSKRMKEMNLKYMGKDSSTDVLSFPMYENEDILHEGIEPTLLGDICISYEDSLLESSERKEGFINCVNRLFVHGALHIFGFDHKADRYETTEMSKLEEMILSLDIRY